IACPDVDAVLVLTAGSHAEPAIAAARAGKHVFVEKPMCYTAREADEMIAAATASGVTLMVGYMKAYDPTYLTARDLWQGMVRAAEAAEQRDRVGRGEWARGRVRLRPRDALRARVGARRAALDGRVDRRLRAAAAGDARIPVAVPPQRRHRAAGRRERRAGLR